ncbi:hypothetical protein FN846DRAFT_962053, partial [Sphaerosporella brunnea]
MAATSTTDPLIRLDSDILAQIVTYLEPVDVVRLQRVSRGWMMLLGSQWIARVALIAHFPYTTVALELCNKEQIDAVLSYRRCVYRSHTRALGCPTRISHFVLEPTAGILEWGTAGEYVCWVARPSTTLYCQRIGGGPGSRVSVLFMDVIREHNLPISRDDIVDSLLRLQIGDVLSVTLNCYDGIDDDDGSGRRAFILVFELATLRFLWFEAIQNPYKMLGEPDTAKDNFIYVRKTVTDNPAPSGQMEGPPTPPPDIEVHLMVHDIHTGRKKCEIGLQRGDEIAKGDLFFIVVSDSSFKRLVVLFERGIPDEKAHVTVYARVYSLSNAHAAPGRLISEYKISGNHSSLFPRGRQHQLRANSSVCVDYPSRLEKFDIVESLFVTAQIPWSERSRTGAPSDPVEDAIPDNMEADLLRLCRAMTGRLGLYAPIHLSPPVIPYAVWEVSGHKKNSSKLHLYPRRYLAELSMERDFFVDEEFTQSGGPPEFCSRFEVFLPLEECSAIFSQRGKGIFTVDVACYEPINEEEYQRNFAYRATTTPSTDWIIPTDQDANNMFSRNNEDPDRPQAASPSVLMKQRSRRPLNARRLLTPIPPSSACKLQNLEELEHATPYKIDPATGEIIIKGYINSYFLPSVQWSEKAFTIRTNWSEELPPDVWESLPATDRSPRVPSRANVTGIAVFDFSPP